jgi:hypothetical protein
MKTLLNVLWVLEPTNWGLALSCRVSRCSLSLPTLNLSKRYPRSEDAEQKVTYRIRHFSYVWSLSFAALENGNQSRICDGMSKSWYSLLIPRSFHTRTWPFSLTSNQKDEVTACQVRWVDWVIKFAEIVFCQCLCNNVLVVDQGNIRMSMHASCVRFLPCGRYDQVECLDDIGRSTSSCNARHLALS